MEKPVKYERRYELDWLRILAVILLFFYHSAKVFDMTDFHINNNEQDLGMTIFVAVLSVWLINIKIIYLNFFQKLTIFIAILKT